MYTIPTPKYNTISECMKNDFGAPNKWFVTSQLPPQISKTLPSHDVIKTITINFYGISGKPDQNITLWVLLI